MNFDERLPEILYRFNLKTNSWEEVADPVYDETPYPLPGLLTVEELNDWYADLYLDATECWR